MFPPLMKLTPHRADSSARHAERSRVAAPLLIAASPLRATGRIGESFGIPPTRTKLRCNFWAGIIASRSTA